MIGRRPSGIKLTATFDPFIVLPEAAWNQCKKAILATLELYGFHGTVVDDGSQTEAYAKFYEWLKEEQKKDAEKQDGAPKREFCGKCSAGYVYRPGDNFVGRRCECNPRPE